MICFPNCKINLGLYVTEKRKDGFHNIETVFYPVTFCDAIEIVPNNKKTILINYGIIVPNSSNDNLCMKAYHLLKRDNMISSVAIHLLKRIPIGSGLGGGSSDATHTLLLLNNFFSLSLSNEQLRKYAAQLGSDCSFFIENKPLFATGKGDCFEAVKINLTGLHIVIVVPNISVSTAEAYATIKAIKRTISINEIVRQPINKWKLQLTNDFEPIIFAKYPEIKSIKEQLYTMGALYASMSGSGSAVYGIFENNVNIYGKFKGCFEWKGIL